MIFFVFYLLSLFFCHFIHSHVLFLLLIVLPFTLFLNIFMLFCRFGFLLFFRFFCAFFSGPYLLLFFRLTFLLLSWLLEDFLFSMLLDLLWLDFLLGLVSEVAKLLSHSFSFLASVLS